MRISPTTFVIASALSLVGCDMAKANKIVGETNTIVEAANNSFKKGEDAIKAAAEQHADANAAAEAAGPCTDALADAATKYSQASKNLLEAAAIAGITKEFADYLKAMGESHQKSAELMELEKKPCKAFVDKSATAFEDYQKAIEEIDKVRQDLNTIQAKADKIRADNPDKFQK
ncbi:MAG: hypothetical protein U0414_09250 [Polyangiaceae bacterium]